MIADSLQAQLERLVLAHGDVLVVHMPYPITSRAHLDRLHAIFNHALNQATGRASHPILFLDPDITLEIVSAACLAFKPQPDTLADEIHRAYSRKLPTKEQS